MTVRTKARCSGVSWASRSARRSRISPDTLYKYASEGFVPAFKLGNRWRFKRSRLDEWMDRQSEQQAAEIDPEHKKPPRPAM